MTEPLPKSWWVLKENKITEDDSLEEIQRKQLYSRLCAHKKPYFFQFNYNHLKTEYDTFMKNVRSNAISQYKKDLDILINEYKNNKLTDENEIKFMKDFYYKLPLDMSHGTMNRICWAIEREFNGVDIFKDVSFDYSILKSGVEYDKHIYEIIKHICTSYKSSMQLAKKRAVLSCGSDEENEWQSVDIILQNLIESLHASCSNEEELCDILVDLCYRDGVSKQILWTTCGEVIVERLLQSHDYKMTYPKKSDNGDFWCQGVQYIMTEVQVKGGELCERI